MESARKTLETKRSRRWREQKRNAKLKSYYSTAAVLWGLLVVTCFFTSALPNSWWPNYQSFTLSSSVGSSGQQDALRQVQEEKWVQVKSSERTNFPQKREAQQMIVLPSSAESRNFSDEDHSERSPIGPHRLSKFPGASLSWEQDQSSPLAAYHPRRSSEKESRDPAFASREAHSTARGESRPQDDNDSPLLLPQHLTKIIEEDYRQQAQNKEAATTASEDGARAESRPEEDNDDPLLLPQHLTEIIEEDHHQQAQDEEAATTASEGAKAESRPVDDNDDPLLLPQHLTEITEEDYHRQSQNEEATTTASEDTASISQAGDQSSPIAGELRENRGRKSCASVEEMGFAAAGNTDAASLRLRRTIRSYFAEHGARRVRHLPPEAFCERGFVLGKGQEDGFGNNMYKLLTSAGLGLILNRSLIIAGSREGKDGDPNLHLPFGTYLSYSDEAFSLREVRRLWEEHRCPRPLSLRLDSFDSPSESSVLCEDWTLWRKEHPVLWFKGTQDTVALQFLLKNQHPAVRSAAIRVLGDPAEPHSRPNTFGELMLALIRPTPEILGAVDWALRKKESNSGSNSNPNFNPSPEILGAVDWTPRKSISDSNSNSSPSPNSNETVEWALTKESNSNSDPNSNETVDRALIEKSKFDSDPNPNAYPSRRDLGAVDGALRQKTTNSDSNPNPNSIETIEPDVSLHLRMRHSSAKSAAEAAKFCIGRIVQELRLPAIRKRPRIVVVSDTPAIVAFMKKGSLDRWAEVIAFDHRAYLRSGVGNGELLRADSFLPPAKRRKDWGPLPRWVAVVDFFLAARARRAVVSGAHRRVGTTYAQLVAALAAAYTLQEGDQVEDHEQQQSARFYSSFQESLLVQGLMSQGGWGHSWRPFGGKRSCPRQPSQCALTPLLPYAWWDAPWQSPTNRDRVKMGRWGVVVESDGKVTERSIHQFCRHQKKPTGPDSFLLDLPKAKT